jgi:hypothetical protein
VKTALLVVLVVSYATVPASPLGTVTVIGIGTLTSAPVAGFPENGNEIGTLCTSLGSCA